MKKIIILLTVIVLGVFSLPAWDDFPLLTSASAQLKPNIMFLLDNSGSMNTVIMPSFYDPKRNYAGPGCDFSYPGNDFVIKKFGNQYYFVDDVDEVTKLEHLDEISGWDCAREMNLSDCDATDSFVPNQGIYFYPFAESQEEPRYPGNFLNFLLYYATPHQLAIWNHFMIYGNWDAGQGDEISEGVYSPAPAIHSGDTTDPDAANMHGYTAHDNKIRIKVARKTLTEVLWEVFNSYELDPNPDKKRPRIGINIFEHEEDPDGGTLQQKCQDSSVFEAMANNIKGIMADTYTPLAEIYAETWAYFRNGNQAHITDEKYFLPLDDPSCQELSASKPITNWCQLNFILIVTDGESTKDDYMRTLSTLYPNILINTNKVNEWGDADGAGDDDDSATLPLNGTNYLDDLAYFAYNEDLYPDELVKDDTEYDLVFKNKQFIYTYVIGFAIENYILKATAENGRGEFFQANDYQELVKAFKDALSSIDEKVNSYAAFSAPKYSTYTHGTRGYVATFIPRNLKNIWEGHLKCFRLDYNGDFPALLDDLSTVQVYDDDENLVSITSFQWDAGTELINRTSARNIYTVKGGSLVAFNNTNVSAADLGFNSGDATVDDADRDAVIDFIRGNNGYGYVLGDIFHFTPIVVGAPLKWKAEFDASYKSFFDHWTDVVDGDLVSLRPEVVYVGANDGMLHCFRVDNGEELWAFIPPSQLPFLKHSVPGVTGSLDQHNYFVDGKGIAQDIKISQNGDYTDWRTVFLFGMGVGGKTYCALDVTDPANPAFLWEFTNSTYMAYTEGKPIIADIANDGNGNRFPAVILSGGFDKEELPSVPASGGDPSSLLGKSFYVLHAYDGTEIKRFHYGATTSNPDTQASGVYVHTNSGFKYAFASTPSVLDRNYDGIADAFYMFESGDYRGTAGQGARIWRVNVDGDPAGWRPTAVFQADDGQTMYIPATLGYDEGYNLWVLIGTGRRPVPDDPDNPTGQFIGFVDNGNISSPLDSGDLTDISALFSDPDADADISFADKQGFYFEYINGDGETIFEPYPIYINKEVYFNTYMPDQGIKIEDLCNPPGAQFIYNFSLSGTYGGFYISGADSFSGKIQGYGSLTGGIYKVYIGEGEVGSPEIQSQETIDLSDAFGIIFWSERKK